MLFSESTVLPGRHTLAPVPPMSLWGTLIFAFLFVRLCGCLCVGTLGPKWDPRRSKVPKKCQKGAQKLTFRSPKRHFWEPNRREWPLAKTPAGAMFSSHYEGPGLSLFAPKIASGTRCALETLFFPLLCPLWAPKWGPRWSQGNPKSPKGAPKLPPGHLKITKKSTRGPIWKKGRLGRLQGCPREGN